MSEAKISRLAQIQDPALRTFAESLASGLFAASFKAVANHADPKKFPIALGDSLERRFLDYLRARPLESQQRIVARVLPIVTNKQVPGMEGIDFASATPVIDLVKPRLKFGALTTPAGKRALREAPVIEEGAPGFKRQDALDQLKIEILATKCIDETDGFLTLETGNDEMAIGGVAIDAAGTATQIPQVKLGNFGEDGAKRTYNPPLPLATADLRSGSGWPKTFGFLLSFAELDNGKFSGFLDKLLQMAKDALIEYAKKQAGDGPGVGEAVGAALGWVLDKVLNWLKEVWEDDMFKPVLVAFDFDSADARFANGQSETGPMWIEASGHGGKYRLWYNAKLALASEVTEAGGAVVWDAANYIGKSVKLPVGHYRLADLQARGVTNDTVTSLKVGAGLRMIAYQHDNFQGATRLYTGAVNRLLLDMDNQISSLVIEPVYVMLFKDANYTGDSQAFGVGRYDVASLKIGNDQASSVLVPPGYRVTLYKDAGFKGTKKVLTADTGYVGADFNDTVSSVVVELANW